MKPSDVAGLGLLEVSSVGRIAPEVLTFAGVVVGEDVDRAPDWETLPSYCFCEPSCPCEQLQEDSDLRAARTMAYFGSSGFRQPCNSNGGGSNKGQKLMQANDRQGKAKRG